MAYATYITEALVCGTYNRNTSDRSFQLFTREAGMLYADARSVREERSRQRYALQDFSLVRVSLIKGKRGWRIGSIEALKNHYTQAHEKSARGSVVSIYRLLKRFIHGEESHPDLFDYIVEALDMVSLEVAHRIFVEQVLQVNVLERLGYVDAKYISKEVLQARPASIAALYSKNNEHNLEKVLKVAVSASHL